MAELRDSEIELKKYEARMALWKTGVLGGLATILVAIVTGLVSVIVSSQEVKKELEVQALRANHELEMRLVQTENEHVANVDRALSNNVAQRLRFTEYLSIMSATDGQRKRGASIINCY